MSASHKLHRRFAADLKKSVLDHMLDFGEVDHLPQTSGDGKFSASQSRRLQEVMKQLDEISLRIDRLMNNQ